jgi:hypothetical protein
MNAPTTAAQYKKDAESYTGETVSATVPSGAVFTFRQPSPFEVLFEMEALPYAITGKASQSWDLKTLESVSEEDQGKTIQFALKTAQKLLDYSVDPKLVRDNATGDNELSVKELLPDDLSFLLQFIAVGGYASEQLGTFLEQSANSSGTGSNGKRLRKKTKRVTGNKR